MSDAGGRSERPEETAGTAVPLDAYQQGFRQAPVALALTDLDGTLLDATAVFATRLGRPAVPADLRLLDVAPPLLWAHQQVRAGVLFEQPLQGILRRPDDGTELVCMVRLVRDRDGAPAFFLLHLPEVAAELAMQDPLTGLPNRALLLDRVEQALARRSRSGGAVELVVLDLDGFKQINDERGHLVGDAVLVEFARRLSRLVRPADTVARWGGDEFIVLLESPALLDGAAVCERVRVALRAPVTVADATIGVAASCGWVAARPEEDAPAVLHRADREMYRTKRASRAPQPPPADE